MYSWKETEGGRGRERVSGGITGFKKGRMESRLMDLQNNTIPSISVTDRTHIQPGLYTADVLHVITLTSWSSYCLGSPALNPPQLSFPQIIFIEMKRER